MIVLRQLVSQFVLLKTKKGEKYLDIMSLNIL